LCFPADALIAAGENHWALSCSFSLCVTASWFIFQLTTTCYAFSLPAAIAKRMRRSRCYCPTTPSEQGFCRHNQSRPVIPASRTISPRKPLSLPLLHNQAPFRRFQRIPPFAISIEMVDGSCATPSDAIRHRPIGKSLYLSTWAALKSDLVKKLLPGANKLQNHPMVDSLSKLRV
jgi:hypothetical protein